MRQSFSDTEDTFLESLQPACRIGPILLSYTWLVTSGLPPTRFRDANDAENKQSRANLLSFCTLCDDRLQVIVVITFLIHEMSDSCEKLVMIISSFWHLYILYIIAFKKPDLYIWHFAWKKQT